MAPAFVEMYFKNNKFWFQERANIREFGEVSKQFSQQFLYHLF